MSQNIDDDFGNEYTSLKDLEKHTILAVIDIGGNSIKLEIRRANKPDKKPKKLRGGVKHKYKSMCQLAAGLGVDGNINDVAQQCVLNNLEEFKLVLNKLKTQRYNVILDVVGTAPFRYAQNGAEFADKIRKKTGLPLKVLSETEEALLTAEGTHIYFSNDAGECNVSGLTCDLGGGSAEFTIIKNGKVIKLDNGELAAKSLPIGLQRIAALKTEIEKREFIGEYLDALPKEFFQQQFFFPMGGAHRDLTKAYARLHKVNLKDRGPNCFVQSVEFLGFSHISSELFINGKSNDLRDTFLMTETRIPYVSDSHLFLSMVQERAEKMTVIGLSSATMRDALRAEQRQKLRNGEHTPYITAVATQSQYSALTAQI